MASKAGKAYARELMAHHAQLGPQSSNHDQIAELLEGKIADVYDRIVDKDFGSSPGGEGLKLFLEEVDQSDP